LVLLGFALAFFTMLIQLLYGKPTDNLHEETTTVPLSIYTQKSSKPDIEIQNKETVITKETSPKGLYSPRSNIGWEDYTNDRLDSELHRCASTESDLTLLLLEFTDKLSDTQFKQAAEEAVSFFVSRDLLFERGSFGITIIYPSMDLETGLDKAQKFHQQINEKLFLSHKERNCVCIGLSSRAGRLLNAGRILLEAGEALKKAKRDRESPIIAFKSNLDKYRNFIASQIPKHS
jgi:GGDEF domain-containing protein